MAGKINIIVCVAIFIFGVQKMGSQVIVRDSIIFTTPDSVMEIAEIQPIDTFSIKKRDPNQVVWMGAIVPGMGQILNQKYWKLPIVYGGFLACAYAISWNGSRYTSYKNAYRDATDSNPNTNSFLNIYPMSAGVSLNDIGGPSVLKTKQDNFRRSRDLSVLISVLYYGLTVLDAYVDAQLFDFDISPDLSLRVSPAILNNNPHSPVKQKNTLGVQMCFNF